MGANVTEGKLGRDSGAQTQQVESGTQSHKHDLFQQKYYIKVTGTPALI